jgi:mono/diheme cytochrome c family protein
MKGEHRQPQKPFGFAVVVGIGTTLAAIGVVGLLVVYTGAFNIAASEEHTSFVRWAFDTTFRNSVEARSADIVPPDGLTPAMVADGASEYKAMCQHCHGGPGVKRDEWARGLLPHPPQLTQAAEQWRPREVFWLVKHGVKMTGMPAFGPTHHDRTLWNIVALVKELPAMTAEHYASLGEQQEPEHQHHAKH